ncbi:MAG: DUF302 domain-containing protein [Pseudooceanicola sp.]
MMKTCAATLALACLPALATADPITLDAAGSVPDTVERLKASIEGAGLRVFSVVDFGGGARSVGEDVGDIQLVIFGDPKIGAAALSFDPLAALDLPAKVLVRSGSGGTQIIYEHPAEMIAQWAIPSDGPLIAQMEETLRGITTASVE